MIRTVTVQCHTSRMTLVTGSDGELVELFLELIEDLSEDDWIDVAAYTADAIGGEPARYYPAPAGRIPSAGSLAAKHFEDGNTMTRNRYNALLRERLTELVRAGLREDFLIKAVLDAVSETLRTLIDASTANKSRSEMRLKLQKHLDHPEIFREFMERDDPTVTSLSDEEIRERIQNLIGKLGPVQLDEEASHLGLLDRWETTREALIPAGVIDQWRRA